MVRFLSALVVLVGIFVGEADGTTSTIRFAERFAEQYPDPTGEESICQNELNEGDKRRRVMVCDVDSVLGGNKDSHAHSLKLLDEAIRKIEDVKLSVCDGVGTDSVEVAIVLMNEMHHIPLVERPSPSSEDYGAFLSSTAGELASAIHNKYGVGRQAETCGHGHKETHTGLLIFASVKDRVIHFSTTDAPQLTSPLGEYHPCLAHAREDLWRRTILRGSSMYYLMLRHTSRIARIDFSDSSFLLSTIS